MKIISVASPCNGSGKTSLLCSILQSFPGHFRALKCSTIYPGEQFCPASDTDCACRHLEGDFVVIDDEKTIRCPNTDTSRIASSGAIETLWCLARPPHHGRLWNLLRFQYLDPDTALLCEGNSLVTYMDPDLKVFVVRPDCPREWWKENSEEMIRAADLAVINSTDRCQSWTREIEKIRGSFEGIIMADVRAPLNQWGDPRLFDRVSSLLAQAAESRSGIESSRSI